MFFYPQMYVDSIKEITYEILKENNIKAVILDMDNTLIDFELNIIEGAKQWCDNLRQKGIKLLVVSNSNKIMRFQKVSEELGLEYISFAMKPFKRGLKQAEKILGEKPENIAAIGDQIFTDVIGANRAKMYSILVKPLAEKDIFITTLKKPIERYILKKYLKKEQKKNAYK